jgi:hypothetical protein
MLSEFRSTSTFHLAIQLLNVYPREKSDRSTDNRETQIFTAALNVIFIGREIDKYNALSNI